MIGEHRNKENGFIVNSSQTVQPWTVRLILLNALIFNLDIWVSDVGKAYI